MNLYNKKILLTMLIVVLPSLQLLNILNIDSKSKYKNTHQSVAKADITKTSQTRHVAKFKSMKRDIAIKNRFQNMQNRNQAINSSVFLSNKASFKYQVGYSKYNSYGAKNSNFHVTVAKNTTHQAINIGANSISAITVKVSAPGQKWANLTITSNFTPTKDMIPTSIHYLILGAKNINDANVSLNISYEKRTDPMTPITVKIGHFNVNNINANVGTVLSKGAIAGIVVGSIAAAMCIVITGGIYFLWKRVVKTATTEMRAIIALAEDEEALESIRFGRTLYGHESNIQKLSEDFEAKTDIMIKRANHTKLFTGTDKVTKEERMDVMLSAKKKVEAARFAGWRFQTEADNLRTESWLSAPETNPAIGSNDKMLDSHLGSALPTTDPILPSGNPGAANIPDEIEETALPVSPIKQTGGDQERTLLEKQKNDEKERTTVSEKEEEEAMLAKTSEGKDQPPTNGAAEIGERETILPTEGQGANVLGNTDISTKTVIDSEDWSDDELSAGAVYKTKRTFLSVNEKTVKYIDMLKWKQDKWELNCADISQMLPEEVIEFYNVSGIDLAETPVIKDETETGYVFYALGDPEVEDIFLSADQFLQ